MAGKRTLPALVLALALCSCSVLGVVPKQDLDAATARADDLEAQVTSLEAELSASRQELGDLESELAEANADLASARGDVQSLSGENSTLTAELGAWQELRCNHTWNEFINVIGVWLQDDAYVEANDTWNFRAEVTQWMPFGTSWDNNMLGTVVLWDRAGVQSMVLDIENDCILINPQFSDVGQ